MRAKPTTMRVCSTGRNSWRAPPTFARLAVSHWFAWVPEIPFFTIVTKTACSVVLTSQTNTTAPSSRKHEQLSTEATPTSMQVAIASCKTKTDKQTLETSKQNHTFAGLTMGHRLGVVTIIALFAIVTFSTCRIVAAVYTYAPALVTRQRVEFHVEATLSSMEVAIASWKMKRKSHIIQRS